MKFIPHEYQSYCVEYISPTRWLDYFLIWASAEARR